MKNILDMKLFTILSDIYLDFWKLEFRNWKIEKKE
jgi:hypothetical protein